MRATHAERVKNQCPRESPTGERMDVTLEGWNHHNDPAMKKSDQPGGSLKVDGEFQNEHMTEHGRLHDLFQERMASKTPYTTKDLLKDARNLLELDLILLVGSDLTWNKTERGVAPRTDASQVSIEHGDYLSTRMQARQANKRRWYRENPRGSGYEILQSHAYNHC